MLEELLKYIQEIIKGFDAIPVERKEKLQHISSYIKSNQLSGKTSNLIFICTHNSRRSHMSQLWSQAAAYYYDVPEVHCYSGGTEASAFNSSAVKALRKAGFRIEQESSGTNPEYRVTFAEGIDPVKAFSKKYSNEFNPGKDFAAIMTCSDADEACPIVPGAEIRIAIPYEDPKLADNTPEEESRYDERCRQIATEMFYTFSNV